MKGDNEKMGKIKFVRLYTFYREDMFDVVYKSGRVVSYRLPDLPRTVVQFVVNAENRTEQYDPVFKRWEMLYA